MKWVKLDLLLLVLLLVFTNYSQSSVVGELVYFPISPAPRRALNALRLKIASLRLLAPRVALRTTAAVTTFRRPPALFIHHTRCLAMTERVTDIRSFFANKKKAAAAKQAGSNVITKRKAEPPKQAEEVSQGGRSCIAPVFSLSPSLSLSPQTHPPTPRLTVRPRPSPLCPIARLRRELPRRRR